MKKPLSVGYVFKQFHFFPINESFSNFKVYVNLEDQIINLYFPPFSYYFAFIKKCHIEWSIYFYPLNQLGICYYKPRYLTSIGLMFDEIVMNIFRKKAVNQRVDVVDGYFTKTEDNKIYMYRG